MGHGARLAVVGILLCQTCLTLAAAEPDAAGPATVPAPAEAPPAPPAPASPSQEVLALAAQRGAITSLAGTFRWLTGTIDGSGEVGERQGRFTVVRGAGGARPLYNVVASRADGSELHRWCSDGVRRAHVEQLVPEEPPQPTRDASGLDLDRVAACVLLDLPTLTRDFAIGLSDRTLTFTPLPAAELGDLRGIGVRLDAADQPQEVLIDVAPNSRIRLVITGLRQDLPAAELPAQLFHPDGAGE